MPDNRIEQDGLYGRINSLEEEIADLKYTNQKLYKDCVTFAKKLKKIQVSGILDEDVDGLKELNSQYADEIAALKEQIVALTIENQNMREVSQANELKETLEDIEDELPVILEGARRFGRRRRTLRRRDRRSFPGDHPEHRTRERDPHRQHRQLQGAEAR